MDKFTKILNGSVKRKAEKKEDILFSNDYITVHNYEDWSIVEESDCVICIPILRDTNQVILRQEYIPTFKKRDGQELYLNVISGTIEENEKREDCLRRELLEEAGIILRKNFPITFEKTLYMTKGNMSQYHICFIELYREDFQETVAKGDGSVSEDNSKSIKLNFTDIDKLQSVDTITELMLEKLKNRI